MLGNIIVLLLPLLVLVKVRILIVTVYAGIGINRELLKSSKYKVLVKRVA